MTIRLLASIVLTVASAKTLYISHSHLTVFPCSSFPLLFVNQNFVVMAGSINARKTSATGLRMSISALATAFITSPLIAVPRRDRVIQLGDVATARGTSLRGLVISTLVLEK